MDYGELWAWTKSINLVINRVKVINDTLEELGYEKGLASIDYRRGYYRLSWLGHEVAKAKVYDLQQGRDLLAFAEGVRSCVWGLSRDGLLTVCRVGF